MFVVDIPVITLDGSPIERGIIHGETFRDKIHDGIDKWKQDIGSDTGLSPNDYLNQFIDETNFMPAITKWTPGLLKEVEGIAIGSNQEFNTIFARQLSDEEPWHRLEKKLGFKPHEKCSCIGVAPDNISPARIGQNMDMPSYHNGNQILLHIKYPNSSLESFVFTVAGKISLAGMNNAPIGICCNTVLRLNYSKNGLPEDFIVRGFLEKSSLNDALSFINNVTHASGQNYLIGGKDRVLDLECSADSKVEYISERTPGRLCHTNHAFVNKDLESNRQRLHAMTQKQQHEFESKSTSKKRFETLERHLKNQNQYFTINDFKTALKSHDGPVCIHDSEKISLGCLLMEFSDQPKLELSPGPPCSTKFKIYSFEGVA